MGIAVMLVASSVLFLGLVVQFFFRKTGAHVDHVTGNVIREWQPTAIPPLLWLNTAVLLLSSFTMERARRAVFREPAATEEWLGIDHATIRTSLPWLSATLVLGVAFVAGQLEAWRQLAAAGVYLSLNPSSQSYYLLTGLHAVHLLGGIVVLLWVGLAYALRRPIESRQIVVDVTAWYWHAIGLVWLGIFVLLKWGQ
jgi:cytochrome c oxidase subunit 3